MPLRVAQSPPWNHSIFLVDQEAPKIRTFTGNPQKKNGGGGGVVFFFPPKNITHTHTNKKVNLRIIILHFFGKFHQGGTLCDGSIFTFHGFDGLLGIFFRTSFVFLSILRRWLLEERNCIIHSIPGWWFQGFVMFTPTWGNDPILTNIFQMGWNHQPDTI